MNGLTFMNAAFELAQKGEAAVLPNPMVGCVIVYNNEVVAGGYHQRFGEAHAEVNAIGALPEHINPATCTLYVTLEPCSHYGKTPPCAELIISKGFKKVVVAAADPNPLVGGQGIKRLREAGVEVDTGLMEREVRQLNRRFFTFYEKKRPYFILKWAQTADGFISRWPVPERREDNTISGMQSNEMVHSIRASVSSIMVGKNTVLSDNPRLTVRYVKGNNPLRLVLDKNLDIPTYMHVFNSEAPTVIFNGLRNEEREQLKFVKLDFSGGLMGQISDWLYENSIQSVMVEGGAILIESLLKKELWDEIIVIENPALFFHNGIKAPGLEFKTPLKTLGNDMIRHIHRQIS